MHVHLNLNLRPQVRVIPLHPVHRQAAYYPRLPIFDTLLPSFSATDLLSDVPDTGGVFDGSHRPFRA
jgi:hypothetical protein